MAEEVGVSGVLEGSARWCLLTGDGIKVAETMPDHSCVVICDPPYDARTHANARSLAGGKYHKHEIAFDALTDARFVVDFARVSPSWVLCFCALEQLGMYQTAAGAKWVRSGVWHRPDGAPQFTGNRPAQACEGIAIMHAEPGKTSWNGHGSRAFWSCGVERRERYHDTPKPVSLMLDLVRLFTNPDDVIFDPFAGSGTTGVAALILGRRFIGVELDPDRAAIATERLTATEQETTLKAARGGQLGLFG
jgi:site-specific DNA-methyltransferase (adenine-specific)